MAWLEEVDGMSVCYGARVCVSDGLHGYLRDVWRRPMQGSQSLSSADLTSCKTQNTPMAGRHYNVAVVPSSGPPSGPGHRNARLAPAAVPAGLQLSSQGHQSTEWLSCHAAHLRGRKLGRNDTPKFGPAWQARLARSPASTDTNKNFRKLYCCTLNTGSLISGPCFGRETPVRAVAQTGSLLAPASTSRLYPTAFAPRMSTLTGQAGLCHWPRHCS